MPKRIKPPSDIQVKTAKPKTKGYKLANGQGLYLLITPSGGKLWRMDYKFDAKRKTLSFKSAEVSILAALPLQNRHSMSIVPSRSRPSAAGVFPRYFSIQAMWN